MGTFSDASAFYGLKATGTPVGTNVSGTVTIGVGQTQAAFTDADIAYSFKVTSTGFGDEATLTFSTSAVAQTSGAPQISDGDGNDFEGVSIPTLATIKGLLLETPSGNTGYVTFDGTSMPENIQITEVDPGFVALIKSENPGLVGAATLSMTFEASGDEATVTVIGKSS